MGNIQLTCLSGQHKFVPLKFVKNSCYTYTKIVHCISLIQKSTSFTFQCKWTHENKHIFLSTHFFNPNNRRTKNFCLRNYSNKQKNRYKFVAVFNMKYIETRVFSFQHSVFCIRSHFSHFSIFIFSGFDENLFEFINNVFRLPRKLLPAFVILPIFYTDDGCFKSRTIFYNTYVHCAHILCALFTFSH